MSFNAAALALMREKGLSLDDVVEIAAAMESRSKGAERQARYRRAKKARDVTNDDVTGDVTLVLKENISNSPASSEPEGSPEAKRAQKSKFVLPDWVPPEAWAAFEKMRKAMGAKVPFTDEARRGIVRELEDLRGQGHDPEKLLLKAVKKGWRSLFGGDDTLSTKGNGHAQRPLNAQELRRAIAFAEDNADSERAAELKRQLAALNAKPPDPKIAHLIRGATENLRAASR